MYSVLDADGLDVNVLEVLVLLEDVLVQLVEVPDAEGIELLVLNVLELDVDMLDLEVPEVLVLLEGVLVPLVEVLDVEGTEIRVLGVLELDVDAGHRSAGGVGGCAGTADLGA